MLEKRMRNIQLRAGRHGALFLLLCWSCLPNRQPGMVLAEEASEGVKLESDNSSGGDSGQPIMMPPPTCDLCAENWLFVVSAGVGVGTNGLMAMLNGLPGFEIATDHWGFLYAQASAHDELAKLVDMGGASWKHHPADPTNVMCTVQRSMKRVLYGREAQQVVGSAKVIGVLEFQSPTLRLLRFLARAFPCARYVFAHRRETAMREEWIPEVSQWEGNTRMFQALANSFPHTMSMVAVDRAGLREHNTIVHRLLGVRGCVYTSLPRDMENDVFEDPHAMRAHEHLTGRCDVSHISFRLTGAELAAQEETWQRMWEEWHRGVVHVGAPGNDTGREL